MSKGDEVQRTNLQPDRLVHGGNLMRGGEMTGLDILWRRHLDLMLHLHHGGRRVVVRHGVELRLARELELSQAAISQSCPNDNSCTECSTRDEESPQVTQRRRRSYASRGAEGGRSSMPRW